MFLERQKLFGRVRPAFYSLQNPFGVFDIQFLIDTVSFVSVQIFAVFS